VPRRRKATQELVVRLSSGSHAGDVAVGVGGSGLPLMDTPEAKTPEESNEEARPEAEPIANEEIVRQYGGAAGNRANSVLHFMRNDSDGGMPIEPKGRKVANLSIWMQLHPQAGIWEVLRGWKGVMHGMCSWRTSGRVNFCP